MFELDAIDSFESYTYITQLFEQSNPNKVKYYKRRLSFIKDLIMESYQNSRNIFNSNSKFLDQNIISKLKEIRDFGGILKFKQKLILFLLNKIFNYRIDIDQDKIDNFLNRYRLFSIKDLYYLKDNEDFYRDIHKLLHNEGIVVNYWTLYEKMRMDIDYLINNYFTFSFFYDVHSTYKLITEKWLDKGIEFYESGSLARFDKIISELCFIFPFNISDPLVWLKKNFDDLYSYILKYHTKKIKDYHVLKLWISFCKTPVILVFSNNPAIFHIYFLFSERYINIKKCDFQLKKYLETENLEKIVSEFDNYFSNIDDFYSYLGINFVPYELIDYPGIFEIAKNESFDDLVDLSDIKGDLHIHTDFSDGRNSVKEIIEYAKKKGYEYVGISDHIDYLLDKVDRYAIENPSNGFHVFWGVEENVGPNGELFSETDQKARILLDKIDYINLSIHSDFKLPNQSFRILNCLHKGLILCHPTARILGIRDPISIPQEDIFQIFDYANTNRKYIEINSHLDRLDIDYSYIINYRIFKNKELNIVINTDAHSLNQMEYMRFGVKWARKAWCKKKNVLNTKKLSEVKKIIYETNRNSKA
ncbi:MAG: PHP domain-containing protein [Candidatus Calescibacterium sp.]|nr:PHP domain-containing protein [Candidatus Calescibacterium sp.]MCX7971977.1 PHP domain-containing protein [bacterium]MDW8195437.1 PHP domain-containing protein [Candidatus Calescibacterium sp.]